MNESVWAATVRRLLIAKGWTQGDLAKRSGVRENTLSDALRDKTSPRLNTLEKLCAVNALNVPLWRLFVDDRQADLLSRQEQTDAALNRETDVASRIQARILHTLTDIVRKETAAELSGQPMAPPANPLAKPQLAPPLKKKKHG